MSDFRPYTLTENVGSDGIVSMTRLQATVAELENLRRQRDALQVSLAQCRVDLDSWRAEVTRRDALLRSDGYEEMRQHAAELAQRAVAAEADVVRERAARSELEEHERMCLCAIGVAAMCNTHDSARRQRLPRDNPYWTVALKDVCDAVDREIKERERAEKAEAAAEILKLNISNLERAATKNQGYLTKLLDDRAAAEAQSVQLARACRETIQWMDSFIGRDGYKVDAAKMVKHLCQQALEGVTLQVVGDGYVRRLEAERDEARAFANDLTASGGCAWCNWTGPAASVRDHVVACSAHPMRAVEAERDVANVKTARVLHALRALSEKVERECAALSTSTAPWLPDWACAKCVPHSEVLREGLICSRHHALEVLATFKESSP